MKAALDSVCPAARGVVEAYDSWLLREAAEKNMALDNTRAEIVQYISIDTQLFTFTRSAGPS
jgi:hypothetical protein